MLKPTQYAKSFCYGNACYLHNMVNGETLSFPIRYYDMINALFSNDNNMQCNNSVDNGLLTILTDKDFFVDESVCEAERVYMTVVENSHACVILNVTILVTEECNFSCVYCGQSHRPSSMSISTATEVLEFITRELENKKYEGIFVNWFGGEPLLRRDIISFISTSLQERRSC